MIVLTVRATIPNCFDRFLVPVLDSSPASCTHYFSFMGTGTGTGDGINFSMGTGMGTGTAK